MSTGTRNIKSVTTLRFNYLVNTVDTVFIYLPLFKFKMLSTLRFKIQTRHSRRVFNFVDKFNSIQHICPFFNVFMTIDEREKVQNHKKRDYDLISFCFYDQVTFGIQFYKKKNYVTVLVNFSAHNIISLYSDICLYKLSVYD